MIFRKNRKRRLPLRRFEIPFEEEEEEEKLEFTAHASKYAKKGKKKKKNYKSRHEMVFAELPDDSMVEGAEEELDVLELLYKQFCFCFISSSKIDNTNCNNNHNNISEDSKDESFIDLETGKQMNDNESLLSSPDQKDKDTKRKKKKKKKRKTFGQTSDSDSDDDSDTVSLNLNDEEIRAMLDHGYKNDNDNNDDNYNNNNYNDDNINDNNLNLNPSNNTMNDYKPKKKKLTKKQERQLKKKLAEETSRLKMREALESGADNVKGLTLLDRKKEDNYESDLTERYRIALNEFPSFDNNTDPTDSWDYLATEQRRRAHDITVSRKKARLERKIQLIEAGRVDPVAYNAGPLDKFIPSGFKCVRETPLTTEGLINRHVLVFWDDKKKDVYGWYLGKCVQPIHDRGLLNYSIKYDVQKTMNKHLNQVIGTSLSLSGSWGYGQRWVLLEEVEESDAHSNINEERAMMQLGPRGPLQRSDPEPLNLDVSYLPHDSTVKASVNHLNEENSIYHDDL